MASILVTGGAGFIGSHLVDALIARGHRVGVLDRVAPTAERKNQHAVYFLGDIREDIWKDWMHEQAPEVVFHLAACIDDRMSDPLVMNDHNVTGSLRVFEAARHEGVKNIIFASSCAVYGRQTEFPITEQVPPAPETWYGRSKLVGEQYLFAYKSEQTNVAALRFANVYGPRQDGSKESGAIAIFTKHILEEKPFFINGNGETTRDYIFVDDVVAALIAVMESGVSGVYNVGTGKETTTKQVLGSVQQATGVLGESTQRPEVRDAVGRMVLSAEKAKKELAWEAKIALEEGIQKTVAWYKR